MKKVFPAIFLVLALFAACRNENSGKSQSAGKTNQESSADTGKLLEVPYLTVANDSTGSLEIRKNPKANMNNLTAVDVIDALNLKYPEIRLQWVGQKNDTLQVKIEDAEYLTEESGSTGAKAYLAEATYSLTEIKGIHAVDFRFKEGDHASPKIYTRKNFNDLN